MPDAMRSPYLPPVLAAVAVTFLPHALHLPLWVTLVCLCCWGYLLLGRRRGWRPPRKWLRNTLAVLAAALLFLSFGGRPGLQAGVSVLAVLLALKPMELVTRRDAMSTLLLTSFLIVFNLFFAQSLSAMLFAMAGILALAAALVKTAHPGERPLHAVKVAARLLLQGAPLALALFVIFPRLPGGLLGYQAPVTPSGFSDSLTPGDVSNLALRREVAFRASFDGPLPPPAKRYWRGLVLWDFDGRTWSSPPRKDMPVRYRGVAGEAPVSYEIAIEPHGKRWLFALDVPLAAVPWSVLLQDLTLRSRIDVNKQRRYRLQSFMNYNTGPISRWALRRATALPAGTNPQARELAASWLREADSAEAVVARCLDFFRDNGFKYTLSPTPVTENDIDAFLFSSREGFCGHYASAMAFLMRAADVPARVVVGYLGGEENTVGDYLVLRQSDAHAWVEVWLPDKNWVRVDPTATVAPQRLIEGLLAALSGQGDDAMTSRQRPPQWLRTLQMSWDAMNYWWGRTVLDYNWRTQWRLLRMLGLELGRWSTRIAAVLLGLTLLGAGFVALMLLRRLQHARPRRMLPEERIWQRLCRQLAKHGLPRPSWQGPRDYAAAVATARPHLEAAMGRAAEAYALLRFAPPSKEHRAQRLQELKRGTREVSRALRSRR